MPTTSAFGLTIDAPVALPGVRGRGARRVRLDVLSTSELERTWRRPGAARVLERRFPDGRLVMAVDRHEECGYRVYAPRHGRHVVSHDGLVVRSALPRVAPWRWQRLLFAQVLPLAAALQGLELFHASGVGLDGRSIAFIGPPGTGKSSLAAHLVAGGASLVADDVLALEPSGDAVVAHPGAAQAGLDERELRAMDPGGRDRFGRVVGRADKVYLEPKLADRPLPLGALYFLRRAANGGGLAIDAEPDPRRLLAGSFLSYLATPQHLAAHLEVCSLVARSVPTFLITIPASVSARGVAEAVEAHAR